MPESRRDEQGEGGAQETGGVVCEEQQHVAGMRQLIRRDVVLSVM